MERDQYDLMFRQEERHWWYLGMRRIAEELLERFFRPDSSSPDLLDAGCGSGGTTAWLGRWGRVSGLDVDPSALGLARRRGLGRLLRGSVEALPFANDSFHLVTSFDVLYHLRVENDRAVLAEFRRVLRPGGLVLLRVPAHDWLRGVHDQAVHTRHRYHRAELVRKLRAAGFLIQRASYANCILFPLAPVKRLMERRSPASYTDLWQPPGLLNGLLRALLGLEASPIARFGLPWGLSIVAVGQKPTPGSNVQAPNANVQSRESEVRLPSSSEPPVEDRSGV